MLLLLRLISPIDDPDPVKRCIQELIINADFDPRIVFLHRLSTRRQMSPFFPGRTLLELKTKHGVGFMATQHAIIGPDVNLVEIKKKMSGSKNNKENMIPVQILRSEF